MTHWKNGCKIDQMKGEIAVDESSMTSTSNVKRAYSSKN